MMNAIKKVDQRNTPIGCSRTTVPRNWQYATRSQDFSGILETRSNNSRDHCSNLSSISCLGSGGRSRHGYSQQRQHQSLVPGNQPHNLLCGRRALMRLVVDSISGKSPEYPQECRELGPLSLQIEFSISHPMSPGNFCRFPFYLARRRSGICFRTAD